MRPAGVLAAVALLAAGAARGDVEGFHYTREVEVPAAGWVRVPLDLPALQHLAPEAMDLHVFAPGGEEMPVRVAPSVPRSERSPVTVQNVAKEGKGWVILLDTGAGTAPHERLVFDVARTTVAPAVVLESSPDNAAWHPLAAGDLFRIGSADGLERTSLSYPATRDRYLRLHWPAEAGLPRVSAVEVETVTGPSVTVDVQDAECDTAHSGVAVCLLNLPASGQLLRRLTLEIESDGRVGYVLREPRGGRWSPLASGVWQREGERTRHLLTGTREPLAGNLLRLELYGTGQVSPRLAAWGADLAVQTVLFRAEEAGVYTLAYGGGGGAPAETLPARRPRPGVETAWLEAGPEREHPLPALPPTVTAPGVALGDRGFSGSWTVIAPSAKPGDLVRLEIPDRVYGTAREDLGDLRLAAGERQIPFFRWSPPVPVLAAEERDLQPDAVSRGGSESQVEINLPEPGLPLSGLDLSVPPAPLRRAVGVRYLRPARSLREKAEGLDEPPVARETWECRPEPPLPCRQSLSLPGPAPALLGVRFHDGDNPPLAGLDATVWRRSDVLLFVWPDVGAETPVRLLAGAEGLRDPSYDLETLGDVLLGRPWQPAELDLEGLAAERGPGWSRWVMPATLAVAGIFLLLLLRRILTES
ncbi:MAG TPA: DUF3999 family protein [Thermoanaerobaculia bacterium]|nr:DUF3999 family protein [Thermoanaerobaculia bacterium]